MCNNDLVACWDSVGEYSPDVAFSASRYFDFFFSSESRFISQSFYRVYNQQFMFRIITYFIPHKSHPGVSQHAQGDRA